MIYARQVYFNQRWAQIGVVDCAERTL